MKISASRYDAECYDNGGYCTECDEITTYGIEPDAQGCECEACGSQSVMGVEEALISGLIEVSG